MSANLSIVEMALELRSAVNIPQAMQMIVTDVSRLANASSVSLFLIDHESIASNASTSLIYAHASVEVGSSPFIEEVFELVHDSSLVGLVARERKPLFFESKSAKTGIQEEGVISAIPLMTISGQLLAVIRLSFDTPKRLADISDLITYSLFISGLFEALIKTNQPVDQRRNTLLLQFTRDINEAVTTFHIEDVINLILETTQRALDAERVSLYLIDEDRANFEVYCWKDVEQPHIISISSSFAGHVTRSGEIIWMADAYDDDRFKKSLHLPSEHKPMAVLAIPLVDVEGVVVGIIEVINRIHYHRRISPDPISSVSQEVHSFDASIDLSTSFSQSKNTTLGEFPIVPNGLRALQRIDSANSVATDSSDNSTPVSLVKRMDGVYPFVSADVNTLESIAALSSSALRGVQFLDEATRAQKTTNAVMDIVQATTCPKSGMSMPLSLVRSVSDGGPTAAADLLARIQTAARVLLDCEVVNLYIVSLNPIQLPRTSLRRLSGNDYPHVGSSSSSFVSQSGVLSSSLRSSIMNGDKSSPSTPYEFPLEGDEDVDDVYASGELWTLTCSTNLTARRIPVHSSSALAHVVSTGMPLRVDNAHSDPFFNKAIEEPPRVVAQTALLWPVIPADAPLGTKPIAVLQFVNKRPRGVFRSHDRRPSFSNSPFPQDSHSSTLSHGRNTSISVIQESPGAESSSPLSGNGSALSSFHSPAFSHNMYLVPPERNNTPISVANLLSFSSNGSPSNGSVHNSSSHPMAGNPLGESGTDKQTLHVSDTPDRRIASRLLPSSSALLSPSDSASHLGDDESVVPYSPSPVTSRRLSTGRRGGPSSSLVHSMATNGNTSSNSNGNAGGRSPSAVPPSRHPAYSKFPAADDRSIGVFSTEVALALQRRSVELQLLRAVVSMVDRDYVELSNHVAVHEARTLNEYGVDDDCSCSDVDSGAIGMGHNTTVGAGPTDSCNGSCSRSGAGSVSGSAPGSGSSSLVASQNNSFIGPVGSTTAQHTNSADAANTASSHSLLSNQSFSHHLSSISMSLNKARNDRKAAEVLNVSLITQYLPESASTHLHTQLARKDDDCPNGPAFNHNLSLSRGQSLSSTPLLAPAPPAHVQAHTHGHARSGSLGSNASVDTIKRARQMSWAPTDMYHTIASSFAPLGVHGPGGTSSGSASDAEGDSACTSAGAAEGSPHELLGQSVVSDVLSGRFEDGPVDGEPFPSGTRLSSVMQQVSTHRDRHVSPSADMLEKNTLDVEMVEIDDGNTVSTASPVLLFSHRSASSTPQLLPSLSVGLGLGSDTSLVSPGGQSANSALSRISRPSHGMDVMVTSPVQSSRSPILSRSSPLNPNSSISPNSASISSSSRVDNNTRVHPTLVSNQSSVSIQYVESLPSPITMLGGFHLPGASPRLGPAPAIRSLSFRDTSPSASDQPISPRSAGGSSHVNTVSNGSMSSSQINTLSANVYSPSLLALSTPRQSSQNNFNFSLSSGAMNLPDSSENSLSPATLVTSTSLRTSGSRPSSLKLANPISPEIATATSPTNSGGISSSSNSLTELNFAVAIPYGNTSEPVVSTSQMMQISPPRGGSGPFFAAPEPAVPSTNDVPRSSISSMSSTSSLSSTELVDADKVKDKEKEKKEEKRGRRASVTSRILSIFKGKSSDAADPTPSSTPKPSPDASSSSTTSSDPHTLRTNTLTAAAPIPIRVSPPVLPSNVNTSAGTSSPQGERGSETTPTFRPMSVPPLRPIRTTGSGSSAPSTPVALNGFVTHSPRRSQRGGTPNGSPMVSRPISTSNRVGNVHVEQLTFSLIPLDEEDQNTLYSWDWDVFRYALPGEPNLVETPFERAARAAHATHALHNPLASPLFPALPPPVNISEADQGSPLAEQRLFSCLHAIFQRESLLTEFSISLESFEAFCFAIRQRYRPNFFHNWFHAVSVTQAASLLLALPAASVLSPKEKLSTLIAALGHDVDHPGNNNDFEVQSQSALALRHSDDAVLERHHAHMLWAVLLDPFSGGKLLEKWDRVEIKELRKLTIHAILHTDMSRHFDMVSDLATRGSRFREQLAAREKVLQENMVRRARREQLSQQQSGKYSQQHQHNMSMHSMSSSLSNTKSSNSIVGQAHSQTHLHHHGYSHNSTVSEPSPDTFSRDVPIQSATSISGYATQFSMPERGRSSENLRATSSTTSLSFKEASSHTILPTTSSNSLASVPSGSNITLTSSGQLTEQVVSIARPRSSTLSAPGVSPLLPVGPARTVSGASFPSVSLGTLSHQSSQQSGGSSGSLLASMNEENPAVSSTITTSEQFSAQGVLQTSSRLSLGSSAQLQPLALPPEPHAFQDTDKDRQQLIAVVVHSADLSGQAYPYRVNMNWSARIMAEFDSQARREAALGLPTAPFMRSLDDPLQASRLQMSFIANVVTPLWKALADIAPQLDFALENLAAGRRHYELQVARLERAEAQAIEREALERERVRVSQRRLSVNLSPQVGPLAPEQSQSHVSRQS